MDLYQKSGIVGFCVCNIPFLSMVTIIILIASSISFATEYEPKTDGTKCNLVFGSIMLKSVPFHEHDPKVRVSSVIGYILALEKEAEVAGSDLRIQNEMDSLLSKELNAWASGSNGQHTSGIGRRALGNGYFELRGAIGGRVFVKIFMSGGIAHIVVVGKASKKGGGEMGNEQRVFRIMRNHFQDFPEESRFNK